MTAPATKYRAYVQRMGWTRHKPPRFQAVVEFYDPPKEWPIDLAWKQTPILMEIERDALVREQDKQQPDQG